MNIEKITIALHYLTVIVAFIVITYAAVSFQKIGVLWWYILPFCMSIMKINFEKKD